MTATKHNSSLRIEIWKKFNEGCTIKEIADDLGTNETFANKVITERRKAEKLLYQINRDRTIKHRELTIENILAQKIDFSENFILVTNNQEIKDLAIKLGFIK